MRIHELIAEYYQHRVQTGELASEDVPGPKGIAAEWDVSQATACRVRTSFLRNVPGAQGLVRTVPLGPISDMVMAFRFWPKVEPRNADGCMLWDASTRDGSYGQFYLNGKMVYAHRVAWEYRNGPTPPGLEIDHVWDRGCRSQLCVNHEHLEPTSKVENARRAVRALRWQASIQVRTELDEG